MAALNVGIDMMNLDVTKEIIQVIKDFTEDEAINEEVRNKYKNRMKKIAEKHS